MFALWLNKGLLAGKKARLLSEALGVALGKRAAPRHWFEGESDYRASKINFLQARLSDMVRKATPRGYR